MIIFIFIVLYLLYRDKKSIKENSNKNTISKGLNFKINYDSSRYEEKSGISYYQFLSDKGYNGEGKNYYILENLSHYGKTLVNLYIPTEKGTTEIDLVHITTSGIYVIESKNYSGWIFGHFNQKDWTAVYYDKKYKFYNPIWQNRYHIEHLNKILFSLYTTSIVVFSDEAKFKNVTFGNNLVIQQKDLRDILESRSGIHKITVNQVEEFYNILFPYTKAPENIKNEHINRMKNNSFVNDVER